jgi:anti-anti-sigma regulatory factor
MHVTQDETGVRLTLTGALEIGGTEQLRRALLDALAAKAALTIDLSGLEACDAAVLQVLIAARKTAAAAGRELRITALPPAAAEMSAALGLAAGELQCCGPGA